MKFLKQSVILLITIPGVVYVVMSVAAESVTETSTNQNQSARHVSKFGVPPAAPSGDLSGELQLAIETAFGENLKEGVWGPKQREALDLIGKSGDPRLGWIISDLLRIASSRRLMTDLFDAARELLGVEFDRSNAWGEVTDHLMAWDTPAPPDYLRVKRGIYTLIVPQWGKLFIEGDIDWRHVSWGGVRIDDRDYDTTDASCNCIPAADNPKVTTADEADWIDDDDIVFGVVIDGEARAYPRQIMEVREMVNDVLGGRKLGIPYCTLCGSAQAYFTDRVPEGVEHPVLRTSGLLIRSNKVMFDLNTYSVIDTFRGNAVTGELADKGIVLEQAGVVTTEWKRWKAAYPETTVLEETLALGRDPDFRNGRDANGPIFPIGDVDPRLSVHEDVVGIVTESGTPIAFQVKTAIAALENGETVGFENVNLILDGGGLRAVDKAGFDLGGHQAFWFAWSQFYPKTKLWFN